MSLPVICLLTLCFIYFTGSETNRKQHFPVLWHEPATDRSHRPRNQPVHASSVVAPCSSVLVGPGSQCQMGPMALKMAPLQLHRRHPHQPRRCHATSAIGAAVPSARRSTAITTPPHLPPRATFVPQRRRAPASCWADSTTPLARASPGRSPPNNFSSEDGRWPIESFAPAPHGCVGPPCWCCM